MVFALILNFLSVPNLVPRAFPLKVEKPWERGWSVPPSMKMSNTPGDRAFTAAAPSLWNKRPSATRDENNFECFKSNLKTLLELLTMNSSLYFPFLEL